jgi:hypothetical protein
MKQEQPAPASRQQRPEHHEGDEAQVKEQDAISGQSVKHERSDERCVGG